MTTIMQRLGSSVDGFDLWLDREWLRMLWSTASDGIAQLVESILTNGFTTPICIVDDGSDWWAMGNGHHRLTAAILLGLDEIPVAFSNTHSDYMLEKITCDPINKELRFEYDEEFQKIIVASLREAYTEALASNDY